MTSTLDTSLALERGEHPGAVVRRALDARELSVTAAAKALRVGRVALSNFLHGHASLSADMAIRLDKAFGLDMTALLAMQAAFDIAKARRRFHTIHVPKFTKGQS